MYLDNVVMDDNHWAKMVEWAYNHPDRVLSPSEVPEADRPKPCIKIAKETYDKFPTMIKNRLPGIPANTVMNLVKVFGGADLINAVNPDDMYSLRLPTINSKAGIIPVPDMTRFNPKDTFDARTCWTWGLVHGTTVGAATSILLEGIRIPRGLASLTSASSIWANKCPIGTPRSPNGWSLISLTGLPNEEKVNNQSSLELFIGANMPTWHSRLEATIRSNSRWLSWVWQHRVRSIRWCTHSASTQVRFIAVTWDTIPTVTDLKSDDSDDVDYRSSAMNWRPPHERSD